MSNVGNRALSGKKPKGESNGWNFIIYRERNLGSPRDMTPGNTYQD